MNDQIDKKNATVILGNGCFWCTEAVFQLLTGVRNVISGYSGGSTIDPDYKSICSGQTGHAECLQITYDPMMISYEDLLEIFFKTHDPTTLNRQGNDTGTQYRSVIFFENEEQKNIASSYIQQLDNSGIFGKPIVTTLEPLTKFYPAENYHQDYYLQNGIAPYCQFVVKPKVDKFKKEFSHKIRS